MLFGKNKNTTISQKFLSDLEKYLQDKYSAPLEETMLLGDKAAPPMMGMEAMAEPMRAEKKVRPGRARASKKVSESMPMQEMPLEKTVVLEEEETEDTFPEAQEFRFNAAPAAQSRTLDEIIGNVGENFSEMLLRLLIEKDLKNSEVYHRANISRKVFSKIMTNPDYHPKKNTVLALAIGMRLNLDETKDLLARAGYALSPGSKFDLIVQYCIEQREYNIVKINIILDDYRQPCLGE